MGKRTPLYELHVKQGAKIVDFGGWDMPLDYGSQLAEHHQVRKDAGMFDVSHMTIVDLQGEQVREFLRYLLANNIDRLKDPGKALYSCMLNEQGGVLDDLIVYYMTEVWFRTVVNAATREKDLAWITQQAADFNVIVTERPDLAMIAVQGPQARNKVHSVLGDLATQVEDLSPFYIKDLGNMTIARTGYTGEDGYEIMLSGSQAIVLWEKLLDVEVKPCGLGARDTLRLEAGMNLYGTDMDETTSPLESGLGWTVAWEPQERNFIGRDALETQRKEGVKQKLVGLLLEERGVIRNHQKVYVDGLAAGEVTSGSFAPTLGKAIAFARVPAQKTESHCKVEIRGKQVSATVVKPPFARHGKACV